MNMYALDVFIYDIIDELEDLIEEAIINSVENEDDQNEALLNMGNRMESLKDRYEQIKWEWGDY